MIAIQGWPAPGEFPEWTGKRSEYMSGDGGEARQIRLAEPQNETDIAYQPTSLIVSPCQIEHLARALPRFSTEFRRLFQLCAGSKLVYQSADLAHSDVESGPV